MMTPLSARGRLAILFGIPIALVLLIRLLLVLLTGLPFIPPYLYSFDTVNLALALKNFDPTLNQPQPPGYPFFVVEERLLHLLSGTPERTFAALESLISGFSVGMLYLLGRRMFSARVGLVAAALLFVNPVFWFSALTSPLRPHLALISVLIAYCCWRALCGEYRYFYAASVALGLGSGFRPELLLLLFPLWAWTAWQCRGRLMDFLRSAFLLGVTALIWVVVLVTASGGLGRMVSSFSVYTFSQTQQTSVLLAVRSGSWLHSAGRAIVWNGLGVVPWVWTIPFGWRRRHQLPEWKRILGFFAVWFLPSFAFHLIVHIDDPDQALTTIPVLCLAGGFCVAAAEHSLAYWQWLGDLKEKGAVVIWIALVGNLLLFFGQFPLPQRGPVAGFRGLPSVEDAILIGTYESSYARVRWVNQMMELALGKIEDLKSTTNRPILLIWARDGEPVWRKVCYYLPAEKVYALDEKGDPASPVAMARLWSGSARLATYSGTSPIRVPVPKGGRLVWLIAPAAVEGLERVVPLQKAQPLYYTDLSLDSPGFRWGSFEFAPE